MEVVISRLFCDLAICILRVVHKHPLAKLAFFVITEKIVKNLESH